MTLVRLLLVVEPRSTLSMVRIDDVLDDIRISGGAVETSNDVGQASFIAIVTWSDWRGLDEWWRSAKRRADAADQIIRGLILESPTPRAEDEWCDHARQSDRLDPARN